MVDHHHQSVLCCMCGDVGFPDKLFRCNKCRNRFQHSYCSNFYSEFAEPIELCDWCQSEGRNHSIRHGSSSSSNSKKANHDIINGVTNRSEYSGEKMIKHHHDDHSGIIVSATAGKGGKNPNGVPSPRPTPRRYKLLKDVMC